MRSAWVGAAQLLLGSLLLAGAAEPSLALGVLAVLLVVWAVVHTGPAVPGPAVSTCERRRALACRPVPRHRDPDAPGHTRSRAPSGPLPAA